MWRSIGRYASRDQPPNLPVSDHNRAFRNQTRSLVACGARGTEGAVLGTVLVAFCVILVVRLASRETASLTSLSAGAVGQEAAGWWLGPEGAQVEPETA